MVERRSQCQIAIQQQPLGADLYHIAALRRLGFGGELVQIGGRAERVAPPHVVMRIVIGIVGQRGAVTVFTKLQIAGGGGVVICVHLIAAHTHCGFPLGHEFHGILCIHGVGCAAKSIATARSGFLVRAKIWRFSGAEILQGLAVTVFFQILQPRDEFVL